MSAQRQYRHDGEHAIAACALEDIMLLYHRPSGQTHMAISPVPEILGVLGDGEALTAAAVRDRLALRYDLGSTDEALAEIEAHLDGLLALGLVRIA